MACRQCGTELLPGASFCPQCGATVAPAPPAPTTSQTTRTIKVRSASNGAAIGAVAGLLILAAVGGGYWWWTNRSGTSGGAITAVPVDQAASLEQLAQESEQIARQQADLTRAMQEAVSKYQAQSGGQLPDGIGAGLTPEQRALLADRIKNEKMGTGSLLQDLLEKDQQLQQLNERLKQVSGQLPDSVVAADGQRHDRVAMDYLIKKGVDAEQAYRLVSQSSLSDTLVPGFRIWLYYQNGQFGTWVTQGAAKTSPQEVKSRVMQIVEQERDAARDALDGEKQEHTATKADRDDLRNLASLADKGLAQTQADLAEMTAAAERQQALNSTVRYVIGSKNELVKAKVIDGSYRLLPSTVAGTPLVLNGTTSLPPIDPSAFGLRRVGKVTVLPGVVGPGTDYQVTTPEGFVSVAILRPERFAQYAKYFVVVLE